MIPLSMKKLNIVSKHSELMRIWKKTLVQILIVIVIFALVSEMSFGIIYGYETKGQGAFKDGLYMEGELDFILNNLIINGEEWETKFHNILSIYIKYIGLDNNITEKTIETSNLTIMAISSDDVFSSINLKTITDNSKFDSANFIKNNLYIQLNRSSDFQINGILNSTISSDNLDLYNVYIITDNESIEVVKQGWFSLIEREKGDIQFNVTLKKNCNLQSYSGRTMGEYSIIGDIIYLNGELSSTSFGGIIYSNGRIYLNAKKISGKMKITITQNPEKYYNHDSHQYDWAIKYGGEDLEVDGFGLPYWSIGILLSIIPSAILIFHYLTKNKSKEKKAS
jgi:hypothetical protein